MLSIINKNTNQLSSNYKSKLKNWVLKRRSKFCSCIDLNTFIQNNIDIILSGEKEEILALDGQLKNYPEYENFENEIKNIFDYSEFRNYKKTIYNGFSLSADLNIKCCPYCNRNYTTSHTTIYQINGKEKFVFPEFDHFYPKNEYPLLAISFFNLIPSCNICNTHYKESKNPADLNQSSYNIFHPYQKDIVENHFRFKIIPKDYTALIGKSTNIDLDFEYNSSDEVNLQLKNSIAFFGIKDIYEKNHINLIKDIIDKKVSFNNSYMKQLQTTYGLNFEETYKIVFETYYEEENLNKRPFSKLKKDIHNYFEKLNK